MDYEQDSNPNQGVMDRIKESPRTVSALIIILIVAAAIYAFSGDKNRVNQDNLVLNSETPTQSPETSPTTSPTTSTLPSGILPSPSVSGTPAAAMQQVASVMTPVTAEELAAQVKALPAGEKTASAYIEKATPGSSLTVLARRATTRYLNENSAGYAVTNEHRIYIEDYIKDRMQRHPVHVGQSETVSFDLIKEAVASAGSLNQAQLKHLSKYTPHVRF